MVARRSSLPDLFDLGVHDCSFPMQYTLIKELPIYLQDLRAGCLMWTARPVPYHPDVKYAFFQYQYTRKKMTLCSRHTMSSAKRARFLSKFIAILTLSVLLSLPFFLHASSTPRGYLTTNSLYPGLLWASTQEECCRKYCSCRNR